LAGETGEKRRALISPRDLPDEVNLKGVSEREDAFRFIRFAKALGLDPVREIPTLDCTVRRRGTRGARSIFSPSHFVGKRREAKKEEAISAGEAPKKSRNVNFTFADVTWGERK